MNNVLITGGSGFLGEGLIEALLARKDVKRICVYSRGEYRQFLLRQRYTDPRLRWFIGDVRDVDRLVRAMHRIDVVIHAAALKRIEVGEYNPSEMFATNIQGSQNVLDAAERAGVLFATLVSSDKAYQPVSPYGISKAAAESLFRCHSGNVHTSIVRYGNVAGSTGSIIPVWRSMGETVKVTDPDCTRFWMTRDEAVKFVLDAASAGTFHGQVAVPDWLPAFSVRDLAAAMGKRIEIIGLPAHEKKHESMGPTLHSQYARRMTISELKEELKRVQ